ncbi:hypothetical protein NF701_03770 [Sphingomonadaceae bacterium OTU29THOMA1]|nr:hypothetical protein NF701_03770 [Sphingomonadaceae bacterium OTU29THOMA1]
MKTVMAALALTGTLAGMAGAQQAGTRTVQQDFEAAAALSAGSDRPAALAAWEALEKRVATRPRSHAIVLVRKSAALLALDRRDEAVAAARAGLAGLPAAEAALREDRFKAHLNLATIFQYGIDYAGAVVAFQSAEQEAQTPGEKLGALRGLIQTATFTDPAAAAAAAARADALIATVKVDAALAADFASAKAVLALNRGDLPRATAESMTAVKMLGGLTSKTDTRDVAARSNAAIALLLSGRKESARRYMAMTGAGRVPSGSFDMGAAMTPPDCGGEAGLKPADMAVVQFSVADDGTVLVAAPIYAAGGSRVALAFAQAASRWSWSAEQVKAMPPFLRYNARVELRCNMAFERPSVSDGLMADLIAWSAARGAPIADEPDNPAQALPAQRAALAAAKTRGDPGASLPALVALIRSPVVSGEETAALARTALAIAQAGKAPATAQLALDLDARLSGSADVWKRGEYRRLVMPLLTQAPYAADPQARAAIRLLLADAERSRSGKTASALLDEVAGDAALPTNDPLKVGALIRLASIAQQRGDEAEARAAFARSGLSAGQCALIDKPPRILRAGGTFPQEALSWGFEGWTETQFDIGADGKVVNSRAILSYPPFIFTQAGAETASTSLFSRTYRPDGGLACGASTRRVMFRIPD